MSAGEAPHAEDERRRARLELDAAVEILLQNCRSLIAEQRFDSHREFEEFIEASRSFALGGSTTSWTDLWRSGGHVFGGWTASLGDVFESFTERAVEWPGVIRGVTKQREYPFEQSISESDASWGSDEEYKAWSQKWMETLGPNPPPRVVPAFEPIAVSLHTETIDARLVLEKSVRKRRIPALNADRSEDCARVVVGGTVKAHHPRQAANRVDMLVAQLRGALSALRLGFASGDTFEWFPEPLTADPALGSAVRSLEEARLDASGAAESVRLRLQRLSRAFASDAEARKLRIACFLLFRAEAAASRGEEAMYLAAIFESLFLSDKEGKDLSFTVGRVAAFHLARSRGERDEIETYVRDLYDARSRFVHGGALEGGRWDDTRAWDLVYRALIREMSIAP